MQELSQAKPGDIVSYNVPGKTTIYHAEVKLNNRQTNTLLVELIDDTFQGVEDTISYEQVVDILPVG